MTYQTQTQDQAPSELILQRDNLLSDCERSMRYHEERERFFRKWHLIVQFVALGVSGFGTYSFISNLLSAEYHAWMMLAVFLLTLFLVMFSPVDKAHLHSNLKRRFTDMAGRISAAPQPDAATVAAWTEHIHAIFADEPPVYGALEAHCDNQLAIALDNVKLGYWVDLRWYHRLLRNFVPFQGSDFPFRNQTSR